MATAVVPHGSFIAEMKGGGAGIGSFLVVLEMVAAAAKSNARGIINAEPPSGQVEGVDTVVSEFAVAPMPAPMPVVMHEVIDVRAFGSRPLPERVIEVGRNGHLFAVANRGARVVVPGAGIQDFPDHAGAELFHSFDHRRPTAALIAHLNNALVLAGGRDQQLAFVRVVTAWLLDIDMLAGRTGHNGCRCVPMIGRSNEDRVDRFIIEHPADILDAFGG